MKRDIENGNFLKIRSENLLVSSVTNTNQGSQGDDCTKLWSLCSLCSNVSVLCTTKRKRELIESEIFF